MSIDWFDDTISDIISPLNLAHKLAYDQAFIGSTMDRTHEILVLLYNAQDEINRLIDEIEEEPNAK